MKLLKKLFKNPVVTPIHFFIAIIVFAVLHNFFYALFGFEEPVFFILALLSMLGFAISLVYLLVIVIIRKARGKKLGFKTSKLSLGFYLGIAIMLIGYIINMSLENSNPGNWVMLAGLIIIAGMGVIFVIMKFLKRKINSFH